MPHATQAPVVNGGKKSSFKTVDHLMSYPVVNDGVETFKHNQYGKKSIDLADGVYTKFAKPVEPYFETPYNYARPYVSKADELADSGLGHVETRFPIVKEDTTTIVDKGRSVFWWPLSIARQGKDYVLDTWNDEYNKTAAHKDRGTGIGTSVMAIVSTELKIASDFFQAMADFLGPKYEEGKHKGAEYTRKAKDTANQYAEMGQEKANELTMNGEQRVEEVKKVGQAKTEQAKKEAGKTKEQAEKKAQNVQNAHV